MMSYGIEHTAHKDYTGAKIGMWLFLFTEFFLFFGPVLLYTIYRFRYHAAFTASSHELDLAIGSINTAILLTSSLTMAVSISALQRDRTKLSLWMLAATFVLGVVFLINKYFEWTEKFSHGMYPGGEALAGGPPGQGVFYGLYFFLTGLHGLHVLAGITAIGVLAFMVLKKKVSAADHVRLENAGLYWHLVDVVWIYLFPIFYLVR